MDPPLADTLAGALNAAARVASALGAPWWVALAIVAGGVVLLGIRHLPRLAGVKVEETPPPVSDGGTADDEQLRRERPAPLPTGPREPTDGMG
jgi:hypothetical protein